MTKLTFHDVQQKYAITHLGLNPFPWYKQMRNTNPVAIDEQDELCQIFRYKDVQAVLADPLIFSSKYLLAGTELGAERGSLATADPPRHRKLRQLVSQAFTPRSIAKQADNIRGIVNELLDIPGTSGTLEVIGDLATPLSTRVIAGIMGIPLTRQADFTRWVQGIMGHSPEQAIACSQAYENYIRELVRQKRQDRQADLVSALLDAQVDGEPLTEEEIVYFCALLLAAGFETTKHLIGNTILCLDEHPDARAQLWADPSLLPSTIEEVLRFLPIGPRSMRTVTRDTELGGTHIKAGYKVFAWLASANRDEEQWRDPDVFDIRRSPNPHLGFGYGIHFCLGAQLTRLETEILLQQIIERFKDIQRIPEIPLQLIENYNVYGVQQLPIRWQRR